jgi:ribulose-5-phosphate 4-epimerase/fuculose-1-phosphate aldolase
MTTHDVSDREHLAQATRITAAHELIGMFGHLSHFPDPSQDRYLLSPGAGFDKGTCSPADVFDLAFDDEWVQGLPLEIYMHSEVHRMRPEIRALVHTHSPALTQLSTLSDVPGDALLLHASFWPDVVPVFEDTGLVLGRPDAVRLIDQLADSPFILMRWHGAVVVGRTLEEAVFRAIFAEQNARLILDALGSGQPTVPLPGGRERRDIAEAVLTPRMLALHQKYEVSRLPSPNPSNRQEA